MVTNLTVDNVLINLPVGANTHVGILIGQNKGEISHVVVKGSTILKSDSAKANDIGIIAGENNGGYGGAGKIFSSRSSGNLIQVEISDVAGGFVGENL